ncbi:hypothetical protein JTB14_026942 [Gonioctena quinquepunctata]|nr:hypothetical protein JTB14_026942 [Gonioctena quinquepunctata]
MKELDPMNHALFIKNKSIPLPKVKEVKVNIGRTLPVALQGELSPEWKEIADMLKATKLEKEKKDAVKKREEKRMAELSRKHQSMEDPKNSLLLEKNKRKIEKLDENLPTEESEDEYDFSVEELDDMSSKVKLVIAGYKFRHIIGKDYDTPKYRFIKKEFMFFEPKKGEILMQKERMFLNNEEPSTESSDNNGDQDELENQEEVNIAENVSKSTNEKDPIKVNSEKEDLVSMEVDQGEEAVEIPPYRGEKAILSPIQEEAIGTTIPLAKNPPSEHEGEPPPNDKNLLQAEKILEEIKEKTEIYGKNKIKERGEAVISRTPQSMDVLPPPSTPEEENKYEDEYFMYHSKSEEEDEITANVISEKFKEATKILEKIEGKPKDRKDRKGKEVPIILAQTDGPTDRSSDDPSYGSTDENYEPKSQSPKKRARKRRKTSRSVDDTNSDEETRRDSPRKKREPLKKIEKQKASIRITEEQTASSHLTIPPIILNGKHIFGGNLLEEMQKICKKKISHLRSRIRQSLPAKMK